MRGHWGETSPQQEAQLPSHNGDLTPKLRERGVWGSVLGRSCHQEGVGSKQLAGRVPTVGGDGDEGRPPGWDWLVLIRAPPEGSGDRKRDP